MRAASLCLVGLAALLSACHVPPPTREQVMQLGYLTPEQTYETWRTAVQGEYLVQEYECLSKDYRSRNGNLSLSTYSEVRDAILEEKPWLRPGLHRAEAAQVVSRTPEVVVLQALVRGPLWIDDHWLWVRLVREGFTAVHVKDMPSRAMYGKRGVDVLGTNALSARRRGEQTTLHAQVAVPTETDEGTIWPEDIVFVQVGWHWKIDDFGSVNEPLAAETATPEWGG
jgi:hypothetical protein